MPLLRDLTLGQYYPADSPVHRLDPRSKLLALLFFVGLIMITTHRWVFVLSIALVIGAIRLARLPWALALRNLRPFLWLFALTFVVNLTHKSGRILIELPILGVITDEGLYRAVIYTVRIALMIVLAALLTLTTTPMDLTDGLARLLSPLRRLRVSVQDIALMLTIALRFIPIFLEEADRIKKAQMARGATFEGNILRRIRSLIPLVVPLFLSAFRKADELAMAMEARCYRVGQQRSSYRILRLRPPDYALLGTSALLFGLGLVL